MLWQLLLSCPSPTFKPCQCCYCPINAVGNWGRQKSRYCYSASQTLAQPRTTPIFTTEWNPPGECAISRGTGPGQGPDQLEMSLGFYRCFPALLPGMSGLVLVLHVHTALLGAAQQLLHSTPAVREMILAQFTTGRINSLTVPEGKKLLLNSSHIW